MLAETPLNITHMTQISREITPMNDEDLFVLLNHKQAKFDYPVHFHADFELNLVWNTAGQRVVGDSLESFEALDLVLVGSSLPHRWDAPTHEDTQVITMYFHENLLDSKLVNKRLFTSIKDLLMQANRGICFSKETAKITRRRLQELGTIHGFDSALTFLSILYELSTCSGQRCLASTTYDVTSIMRDSKSRRIATVCQYIEANFSGDISLNDVAKQIGMSESAFSHFFKNRTNRNFIQYLNEVRIGHATKMLLETTHSISEVGYACGFGNQSNFNRLFKKHKHQTPTDYRNSLQQVVTKY